ncbi:MAG: Spx/MgsR family RNA polymerase-binding regulatory protein [Cyanobacteria bacterium P01_H01_bin.15]
MTLTVYGIPNCGSCKKAIAWFKANDIDYEFINWKEQPPSRSQITGWIETLGSKPLKNTSGQSYRNLGETKKSMTDADWLEAFAADAMLLKRPLIEKDGIALMTGFRGDAAQIRSTLSI